MLKWDDERGFGYVRTRDSRVLLLVHASEFPHGKRRPQIGDPLSFDIRTGRDGRKEACAVTWDVAPPPADFTRPRPGAADKRTAAPRPVTVIGRERPPPPGMPSWRTPALVLLVVLVVAGLWFAWLPPGPVVDGEAPTSVVAPPQRPEGCDGRSYCSEMKSCEDAKWLLRHCPYTELDYDGDGIPCEETLCR